MKFVLPILIDNLLISHHFLTLASSEFIKCSSVFRSLAEAKTLVSSAKILKHNFSEQFGKSFMYIKNKRGPNVLPCGMPHSIVCLGDSTYMYEDLYTSKHPNLNKDESKLFLKMEIYQSFLKNCTSYVKEK